MPLQPGDKLGRYEILSAVGAGGLGEVYKARDKRLDRTVAVKVLPEHIAKREDLRARFEREARAVASLKHPNICVLHDIGSQDGAGYMVMELLEGETLAARIEKGTLPLDQALKFATQVADALDRAHRAGVTHRDVKPQNIMLTRDGVKVLDFGLAKSSSKPGPTEATLTAVLTTEGTIMGTPQYMAPEQFEGKEADARSDIWAFGAVLYEMVTGQKAFQGKSYSSLLGAILSADPPPMSVKPFTPAWLERLVRRCLAKDPEDRWQTMRDVVIELQAPPQESAAVGPSKTARWPWIAAAAMLAIVAVGLGFGLYRATRPAELKPLVRLDVDLGSDVSLSSQNGAGAILSPDGTRVVYISQNRLFTRRLDQPKSIELAGTDGAGGPFFSADGQWVAFFASGALKKISVEGGTAIALCQAPLGGGGSWGEDGNIIGAFGVPGILSRIPAAGGPPTPVTELGQLETQHAWPQILPGGKAVLFTANAGGGGFDEANIEVESLVDHRRKTLQRRGTFGRYLSSGHLVYVNRGTLFAVPFDLDKLELHGTPAPVLEQVAYSPVTGSAQLDFSRSGTLMYRNAEAAGSPSVSGGGAVLVTVQWLEGTGKTLPLLAKPGFYSRLRLSPDNRRLAMEVRDGSGNDIWIYDWQRDTMARLTFGGKSAGPVWTPDGRYIAFRPEGADGISWTRADGAGKPQSLTQSKVLGIPYSFTPDGKRLAFFASGAGAGYDLWTLPLESDAAGLRAGEPEAFLQTTFNEQLPSFSPDGRWLAYASNESGANQIYVRAFPDKGGKWQISNGGGTYPEWSRNGRDLFYRNPDNQVMVAAYAGKGDSFVADKPRVWSDKRIAATNRPYDLTQDGKRIVALMPVEEKEAQRSQSHVVFLENFADELRRKVPTGK